MDFIAPPTREQFESESEYKRAKAEWDREFKRATKQFGYKDNDQSEADQKWF